MNIGMWIAIFVAIFVAVILPSLNNKKDNDE
jgi:hypothetical protein